MLNEKIAVYIMDDVSYNIYANYQTTSGMDNRIPCSFTIENSLSGQPIGLVSQMPTWKEVFDTYYCVARFTGERLGAFHIKDTT